MQRVVVNNEVSDLRPVISGVPQGSVLDPHLFILFINDLPDNVNSVCRIIADDTKIYSHAGNSELLQNDLFSLFKWSVDWQMAFNISKCKVMHVGKNNPSTAYFVDKETSDCLSVVESEKDLGVIFDTNLHFDEHVYASVNKANRMIGIIYRSFSCMNITSFFRYIRLSYVPFWSMEIVYGAPYSLGNQLFWRRYNGVRLDY